MTESYQICPGIRLKKLPFYEVRHTLKEPHVMTPVSYENMSEEILTIKLTPLQATQVGLNRDIRNKPETKFTVHVQLRICLLDTSCEQDDYLPLILQVKVNEILQPLPKPIRVNQSNVILKRPPQPLNITQNMKLSPDVENFIAIKFKPDPGQVYVASVYLVKQLTSQQLLTKLKAKEIQSPDHTRALIMDKFKEDSDCEIATTIMKISLKCPLSKIRMTIPCRASTCLHLQCFDAPFYLQMNERKSTWKCPICLKPALYDTLIIDGYFQDILKSSLLSPNDNEIQLHKDGSWSIPMTTNEVQVIDESKSNQIK